MTIITTEIQKWKRNKIVWCILALTLLLGAFAIERACSISRSSPFMDSFGDLYTLAFKNLSSLFLPIVLGMFATTLFFDGVGVFFAISPIIALVARMKKGYWLALVFAEIYSFAGLFASMSQQLKTVYPMTTVFNISGYYNANMFQVLIGVVILMVCVILSLLILKGLNRKTK